MKTLVAMGANVNISVDGMTALQYAIEKSGISKESNVDSPEDMSTLLKSAGATCGPENMCSSAPLPESSSDPSPAKSPPDHDKISQKYKELNDLVQVKRHSYQQIRNPVLACEALDALQEVDVYRKTNGCKILCLDGGGVRGLVQIEMLRQIEQRTGKRIVDLFDWIVGTSTGGIMGLALVYGMSLHSIVHFSTVVSLRYVYGSLLQPSYRSQSYKDFTCGSKEKCFHEVESLKRVVVSS